MRMKCYARNEEYDDPHWEPFALCGECKEDNEQAQSAMFADFWSLSPIQQHALRKAVHPQHVPSIFTKIRNNTPPPLQGIEGEHVRQKIYVIAFSQTGTYPDRVCDLVTEAIDAWLDKHGEDVEIVQVIPQMIAVQQMLLIGNTVYGTQYNYTVTVLYIDHNPEEDVANATTDES